MASILAITSRLQSWLVVAPGALTWGREVSLMRMPKIKIMLGVLALILVGFLAWVAFLPRPGRPNVSIKLLGYTKHSSEAPLAMVAVTNLSAFTIFIYRPTSAIMSPTAPRGFTYYFPGAPINGGSFVGNSVEACREISQFRRHRFNHQGDFHFSPIVILARLRSLSAS